MGVELFQIEAYDPVRAQTCYPPDPIQIAAGILSGQIAPDGVTALQNCARPPVAVATSSQAVAAV